MEHGNELTMGSLFDGIGGFPLAAVRNGITPVWASEIEPFPIRVTKYHLPLLFFPNLSVTVLAKPLEAYHGALKETASPKREATAPKAAKGTTKKKAHKMES